MIIGPAGFMHSRSDFLCDFKLSDRDIRLRELVTRYDDECEAYDQTVCTGPILRDGIMPADGHEARLINRNATKVLRRLLEIAGREGYSRAEFMKELGHHSRETK